MAGDRAEAARIALHAGVDMDMVSRTYLETLAASVRDGKVPVDEIDEAVRRVLRIKHRAGLFSHPYADPQRAAHSQPTAESRQLARRFARQCMVLLKNEDGLLPLQGFRRILVTGNFAHARGELFGTWTLDGRAEDAVPLSEALRQAAPRDVELMFETHVDLALHVAHHADAVVLVLASTPAVRARMPTSAT